jgi:RimJ/RimL family protein N-acetyltransferase
MILDPAWDVYLETDRLILRRFTPADADLLIELDSDPAVMTYLTGGKPTDPAAVRDRILPALIADYDRFPSYGFFPAHTRADGAFIGWFALRPKRDGADRDPELGYRLRQAAWGKGYATEGSIALLRKAFTELGAARVYAETMFVNRGSRNVMEKAGLTYVRTFFQDWPEQIGGSEFGEVEYAVTREEWEAARGAENDGQSKQHS